MTDQAEDYDAILYDAMPVNLGGVCRVWGRIKEDKKQRFDDGAGVWTSRVLGYEQGLLRTKNSTYNVIWRNADCLPDLYAALIADRKQAAEEGA